MDTVQVFLREKIKNLGSAIFFNQSDAVLKLPTSIVRIIHVDEYGYLWFFVQKPPQQLTEFEKEFPVKLDFFRKGQDYSLQVIGNGYIVSDPEELFIITTNVNEVKHFNPGELVLIKVKMTRADYFDNITGNKSSWLRNAINVLQSWIFHHAPSYGPTTYYPKVSEVS
jgi:general stress protein 26